MGVAGAVSGFCFYTRHVQKFGQVLIDPKEKSREVSRLCALEHYDRTRLLLFADTPAYNEQI